MDNIQFINNAWEEYLSWSNDKATQKRINLLILVFTKEKDREHRPSVDILPIYN